MSASSVASNARGAHLEALIETSPVGVVVFDAATGHPESFNREARRIVEPLRSPGQLLEALLETVTTRRGDGREVALKEYPLARQLDNAETVRAEEITISVPDGSSISVLVNATPVLSDDGTVVSVVVTMQDLAPLQELERQRSEFLGLVSHELRAPLMSIKGSADTLLGGGSDLDPAEVRAFHRIIQSQAEHMRGLIADLLDAERIEAGTLTVQPEPSEVAPLLDRARNTFMSAGGRHAILVDIPSDLPPVMADRRRVVQVFNNLLANAARQAPESSPIRVEATSGGDHVSITVSDEGRGIAPEHLPLLFRKHSSQIVGEERQAGAGLGLAICRGLVEAHGGRIWAESAGEGQGARFTFQLPLAPGTAHAADSSDVGRRSEERRGHIPILAVDDDPHILRMVRDALAQAGYAPVVTDDPGKVPELLRTKSPHLVLLDLMLPGVDGIELMKRVPELADRPIIFISAYGRDETIAQALEAGAADYIVKPFSHTELTARVGATLRKKAGPKAFVLGDLAIDYERRRVSVSRREISLTAKEYDLLHLLSRNAGRVTRSDSLRRQLWANHNPSGPDPVRNFIKNLRRKLGDSAAEPTWIFNERGVGYRMPKPDHS